MFETLVGDDIAGWYVQVWQSKNSHQAWQLPLTIKPLVLFVERSPIFVECTPSMFNMEPENNDFQKGLSFFQGVIFRWNHVKLQGDFRRPHARFYRRPKPWPVQRKKLRKATTWRHWKRGHLRRWQGKWSLGESYDVFWFFAVCSSPLWK